MAPRDPGKVQADFPQLVADLIEQLRLTGTLGVLEFSDEISPVFLVGSRGITFGSLLPNFTSSQVFSGFQDAPAANTVIADSGALTAGTYDFAAHMSMEGNQAARVAYVLEHRNAANSATLATLLQMITAGTDFGDRHGNVPLMGYVIGTNERIRAVSPNSTGAAFACSAEIYLSIRLTP